jgi:hypothetical protein
MLTEHLGDVGVTGTAAVLSVVTYMDACRDRPLEQWPHRKVIIKTIVLFTATIVTVEIARHLTIRHTVHCVRWVRWQTTRLPRFGRQRK